MELLELSCQLDDSRSTGLLDITSDFQLELYRRMYTVRRFEERALDLFTSAEVHGTIHACIGEECCSVGVVSALDRKRDIVFSNHRGHGHFLTLTDDVEGLIAEIMGRASGVCGGVGGSQHLHAASFFSNGIQGGIVPVATGMALAEREKGSGAVTVVFLGDGTMGQGVVYESFNLASRWSLPILFVITNNLYAQTTPYQLAHAGALANRPAAFEIEGRSRHADSVLAVYEDAFDLVSSIRTTGRPAYLYLETYRLAAHSKGDDTRDPEEVARFRAQDPLVRFAETLPRERRERIEQVVEERMEAAIRQAREAPTLNFSDYRDRCVAARIYVQ